MDDCLLNHLASGNVSSRMGLEEVAKLLMAKDGRDVLNPSTVGPSSVEQIVESTGQYEVSKHAKK
jgi:hypothetical protein